MKLRIQLKLDSKKFELILDNLKRSKLISIQKGKLHKETVNMNQKKTSKLYKAWKNQVRLLSLGADVRGDDENYQFSVFYSAHAGSQEIVQKHFFEFLSKVKDVVKSSKPDHTFQLNFDLQKWV